MDISGAVAFVTGASGGLGSRICRRLTDEGAVIAIGYNKGRERAEEVKSRVQAKGGSAITVQVDQTIPASIEAAVSTVVAELGSLDILVNNAAIASGGHSIEPGDLDAFTPDIWDEMMAVNVRGPYLFARAAAGHLRASKWGRVVNIGSTLGHGDWYQDRIFAPSKAAVIPLTRFLAASLAPDVTVNCVAPGLMVETALGGGGPKQGGNNKVYDSWRDRSALSEAAPRRLPATVYLRELRERGYAGGISVLKDWLAEQHPVMPAPPIVRFETPPGRQAQAD